jgi:hypothetical protein
LITQKGNFDLFYFSLFALSNFVYSFLLPQYAPFPKSWVRKYRLGIQCGGLINHATRTRNLVFHLSFYSKGPNLVISNLYHHLYTMLVIEKRAHPPELFLQADNCWRENKNRWFFAFCSWLVMTGIFVTVTLSFLLQGHTHEDIDQLFCPFAKKYTRAIVWDMTGLMQLVAQAYPSPDTRPVPIVLQFAHDWKAFFDPVLLPMQGHSGPHVFVFKRNADAKVVMHYKDYHSTIDPLRGGDGDGGLSVISSIPPGTPHILPRLPLPADTAKIPELFSMPAFPQDAIHEWEKIVAGNIPEVPVPEDYFNLEKMRFQGASRNYTVQLPPTGFAISQQGGYQSESSTVCFFIIFN